MKNNILLLLLTLILTSFSGCSHDHSHDEETAPDNISVTQFNKATELFMEYPPLIAGQEAKFLIHLTDLKDFKAVISGSLTIFWTGTGGDTIRVSAPAPARAGIFTPLVTFRQPGTYTMTMDLTGEQVTDRIIVHNLKIFANAAELPPVEDEPAPQLISFLKEQQWKIDFATVPIVRTRLQASAPATGEIQAKPELSAQIISPVAGVLLPRYNQNLPRHGQQVRRGDVLLHISPTADASLNIQRVKNEYLLAKAEFDRVQSLFERKAIPQRRFDEAKFDFESKQASYNALADQIRFAENGFEIIAPIDGTVEALNISLGSQIAAGHGLLSIIDSRRLMLKVNVPSSRFEAANASRDATFRIEGYEPWLRISALGGRRLSVGSILSGESRSVPVYFEFNNPGNLIKVGMYAEVFITTGQTEETLAIPASAIIHEDGLHTVYVQIEGEAFEKRIITPGVIDGDLVQVLAGLSEGERIVSRGAYQVRLAALSPESAIGQGHVH